MDLLSEKRHLKGWPIGFTRRGNIVFCYPFFVLFSLLVPGAENRARDSPLNMSAKQRATFKRD